MTGVLLAGCGPQESGTEGSESEKSDKLIIWEDKEKAIGIEDAIAEFEKEHDVTVEVIEKNYAQQLEDLRLDGPGGSGPDVFTMPGDQMGSAVTEGLVKEIAVDETLQSSYTESAMESQIVDGKVYGLPKAVETTMLYYNKDIISEEELPQDLEGWFNYSKEVRQGENYGFLAQFDQTYYANSVLSGYGGYVFGKNSDGTFNPEDIGLNNEGAVEGATEIKRFYDEKIFPAGMVGEQGINVIESLFTEGKAAAIISGPWNLEPFESAGVNYGIASLPKLSNGENMRAFIGVKSYNVSTFSKNAELAEELVKYLSSEEVSKVRYEKTKEVPAVKTLAEDQEVMESEASKAIAEQSQFSDLTPGIPEMNEVWKPADAALQTIATGKSEPKEALDQAVKSIEGQIEANHGGK
ncbi:extracellular solute-binding protein [Terribacillus saccharophilus]|uniref:sugar ABC transporter substrate-binding protein n=1 Tax=Terribacillus saccharophilus TaxID=361277 RepID=UPI003981A5A0